MLHQYGNRYRSTTELGFCMEENIPYPQEWESWEYNDKVLSLSHIFLSHDGDEICRDSAYFDMEGASQEDWRKVLIRLLYPEVEVLDNSNSIRVWPNA